MVMMVKSWSIIHISPKRLAVMLIVLLLAGQGNSGRAFSQANKRPAFDQRTDSLLVLRAFPLLHFLNSSAGATRAIADDEVLQTVNRSWRERVRNVLKVCNSASCIASSLKITDTENAIIAKQLALLVSSGSLPEGMTASLKASNAYANYQDRPDSTFIRLAWQDAAAGLNRVFDVYLAGRKPRYPSIDSISFNAASPAFFTLVKNKLSTNRLAGRYAFYKEALEFALLALAINKRDEAARYIPLIGGINADAFAAAAKVNWSAYSYSAILVPGFGPEKGERIDHRSVARCQMAAERFKKGLAPFLIVSGGHVYPAGTPYSEAIEMKRYLVDSLGIAAKYIIVEPHARHTTTNVRNASRLVYLFGMPADKPVLVVTDPAQTKMVVELSARTIRELGYVPFRDVKKISEEESVFYPVKNAFHTDYNDTLDP